MNTNAYRPIATGAREARSVPGMRAMARALLVLPAAVLWHGREHQPASRAAR